MYMQEMCPKICTHHCRIMSTSLPTSDHTKPSLFFFFQKYQYQLPFTYFSLSEQKKTQTKKLYKHNKNPEIIFLWLHLQQCKKVTWWFVKRRNNPVNSRLIHWVVKKRFPKDSLLSHNNISRVQQLLSFLIYIWT